jgi:hypothetical protein
MSPFVCTRCDGFGFLNLHQIEEETLAKFDASHDPQVILDWIDEQAARAIRAGGCTCGVETPPCYYCTHIAHDVSVCDCCGDGQSWYGTPGQHDGDDPHDPCGCR